MIDKEKLPKIWSVEKITVSFAPSKLPDHLFKLQRLAEFGFESRRRDSWFCTGWFWPGSAMRRVLTKPDSDKLWLPMDEGAGRSRMGSCDQD